MRILFLTPYPADEAPSQRFRFEQYLPAMVEHGIQFEMHSFFSTDAWRIVYKPGHLFTKLRLVSAGFSKRFALLFRLSDFDLVFIHREASPFGPPLFEWIIAKVLRKKITYDFDDAIWLTDKTNESLLEKVIRNRNKVKKICTWSYKVSCGNQYLCNYARQFNTNSIVNPTTLDTDRHTPQERIEKIDPSVVIGWTGSHSTLKYLKPIEHVIQKLEKKYSFLKFLVIADQPPVLQIQSLQFIPWTKQHEIQDLMRIDIGIMPLPDDPWSNGKCGFKALQYMALKIPAIASPVGVNIDIIDQGINGYLCATDDEWLLALESLIHDIQKRKSMGLKGREKVVQRFSISSNTSNFLSLLK